MSTLEHAIIELMNMGADLDTATIAFRRRYVIHCLKLEKCHMQNAAKRLGVHRNTVTRLVKDLNIWPSEVEG